MISISDFCDQHRACKDGREWALANCSDMPDAWEKLRPDWLIWIATRPGVLTDRELRLFAVFCARQVEHLLTDQRSRDAISMAEKFAKGEATTGELAAAWALGAAAARAAAGVAARDAAWAAADASWAAAGVAARAAARAVADAAWAAAGVAARDAAWAAADAARAAAGVAARDAAWAAADASWAAAGVAARAAARAVADAAWAAAGAAAGDAQSDWLRENTKPNFGVEVTS